MISGFNIEFASSLVVDTYMSGHGLHHEEYNAIAIRLHVKDLSARVK